MERRRGFEICKGYEDREINLPKRQTAHSIGYDLESAEDIVIPSIWKQAIKLARWNFSKKNLAKPTYVKTGVKSYFGEDEVLYLYNRSSNPMKRGLILANSVGVIECDYYSNESNDGNLTFAFYNFFPFDITIKKGERIGQAVFQKFLKADEDNATGTRKGGFGTTN